MALISSHSEKINQLNNGVNMCGPMSLNKIMEWFKNLSQEEKDKITWYCNLTNEERTRLNTIREYRKAFGDYHIEQY